MVWYGMVEVWGHLVQFRNAEKYTDVLDRLT